MKQILASFTALALLLSLCACSKKVEEPTWQEQFDLGVRYLSEGNYEEAILVFAAAIEIDPKQAETYEKLADAYLALGNVEKALETLRVGYAATEDERLQARIKELAAPEATPTFEPTPEPTVEPAPEPTLEATPEPIPEPMTGPTQESTPTSIQNQDFIIEDGNLVEYIGPGGDVTIPSEVTNIEVCAFQFTNVTSVTIPSSVTSIGYCAFYGCASLTSIDIPSSVTNIDGAAVFGGCSSLQACNAASDNKYYSSNNGVLFNKAQTAIILYPEGKTAASYTIPSGVTSISEYAFDGCSNLTSVTIPSSVTRIECYAFEGCSRLTSITIPNGVTSIEHATFNGCSSLTSVTIPSSVTSIETGAFFDCTSLTSITIPSSVTSIKTSVFGGCTGLTSVTIPSSVTNIEIGAFINCNQLADIYYTGTEEQWAAISIGDRSNDALLSATIHFNS